MARFIDRRKSTHKSAVNRERFMRRFKRQIQDAVTQAALKRSITSTDQQNISIADKDLNEPCFEIAPGGTREIVHAGNQHFVKGDTFKRASTSPQTGSAASDTGTAEDDFVFTVSREEFLNLFFDDLALPNLVKTELATIASEKKVKKGITQTGTPNNINVVRSMQQALGRKIAFTSPIKRQIKKLEDKLKTLTDTANTDPFEIAQITQQIEQLEHKIANIPYLDPLDLRYNAFAKRQEPTSQAVMFCLMDVSGSMDEPKKEIAKKFFILLYLFLNKTYQNVEIVFIRHHTLAKEVNEQEFFYSRETGGTVVSSALELMKDIIDKRYPSSDWNIYAAQASDGDNWNNDSPRCKAILEHQIMPFVQYYAYIEIMPRHHQSLWEHYKSVDQGNDNFSMQHIEHAKDIYPVFRNLFKRDQKLASSTHKV